ncbi:MAG TPA: hypothetical protein VEQ63_11030 [Bryobacteraceae bacterium]|nr:hypothetical protein [Bryobacteraceae bacterium]
MVNHVVVHLTLLLALPLSTPAYSQLDPSWRFWYTGDGMAESYTRSVSAGPGAIWLRHGNTKLMNTFDGYRMSSLPEPRLSQTSEVQWSKAARVYGSLCGDAWTVEDRGLKQFTGGSWITRGKSNDADPMLHAVPLKDCRVAVLYGDRLVAYNPSNKIWVLLQRSRDADIGSFRTLVPGLTGELWIGGEHGVARLMMDGAASGLQWSTYPTSGFGIGDLKHLLPSDDGSLHVTGTSQRSQDYVALRLERGRFSTIYQSSQPLRSWRGDNATTWVLESTTLWRLHGGQKHRIERRGALSGIVYDVTTEARGVFWIATSVGLARHAPPHWRSPDEIAGLDEPVHAIVEDEQRGLWFAGNTNLIHFDGIRWTIHPLPRDHQTHTTQTTALAYLNGRIVVPAMVKSEGDVVLSFNPKSRRWTEVKHPSGRPVTLGWRASPDRYYVRVGGPCALEEYDGLRFFPRPEVAAGPFCSKVRYLFENERGLYIGTTAMGAGHVYNGVVAAIGASEGLPENAVYTIFEDSPGRLLMGARDTLSEFDGSIHV